jgi:diguanylate cyclase (GGDEF)-like protein
MNQKIDLLRKVELFSTLKNEELDIVGRYSDYYSYQSGEIIFQEGKHNEELYIISDGEVLITKHLNGNRDMDLARFISGECFGEMNLFDSALRNTVARAERDTTLLLFPMKGMKFQEIIHEHPDVFAHILHKIIAGIAKRIRTANRLICEKEPWIQKLKSQIMKDELTGLHNRTYLAERLPTLCSPGRHRTCVLLLKPDQFKKINDVYGHEAGDRVLQLMAETLKSLVRKNDILIRFQGDEFLIVLPRTDDTRAFMIAEQCRKEIRAMDLTGIVEEDFPFTASVGVAVHDGKAGHSDRIITAATEAMLRARKKGGDCVLGGVGNAN